MFEKYIIYSSNLDTMSSFFHMFKIKMFNNACVWNGLISVKMDEIKQQIMKVFFSL